MKFIIGRFRDGSILGGSERYIFCVWRQKFRVVTLVCPLRSARSQKSDDAFTYILQRERLNIVAVLGKEK